jgi:hypothetical protein
VKLKRQLAVCFSFSHSIFGISLSFGISQSFQHLWGCLPGLFEFGDDLSHDLDRFRFEALQMDRKTPHLTANPPRMLQKARQISRRHIVNDRHFNNLSPVSICNGASQCRCGQSQYDTFDNKPFLFAIVGIRLMKT